MRYSRVGKNFPDWYGLAMRGAALGSRLDAGGRMWPEPDATTTKETAA
jgi:hypothetical protein